MAGKDENQEPKSVEDAFKDFASFATKDGEVIPPEKPVAQKPPAKAADDGDATDDDSGDADGDDADSDDVDDSDATDDDSGDADGDDADSDDADAGDGKKADKKPAKPAANFNPRTVQGRINQALERQRHAEERAAAAEARIAALEGRLTPKADATTNEKGDDVPPDPKDFEYGELDTKYIAATVAHRVRQEMKVAQEAQAKTYKEQAAAQQRQELARQFNDFTAAGAEKYDDFEDVVVEGAKAGEYPLSPELGQLCMGSEHGPDIAYHLATHPKEARKVYGKSPLEQAAYFGALEAKFAAATAPGEDKTPSKTPSKAPPPVKGVKGARGKAKVSPATEDFAEFERLARAE